MAEVKNAFVGSKMNKDLEARLVPSGEYRNAVNAQISRSEGADVGALENALGNSLKVDFSVKEGLAAGTLNVIGAHVDEINNFIYVFLTDYSGSTYSTSANNYIYRYNTISNIAVKLVQGAFLNFSTRNPIYGINILEDFLFFTDNRNQPRKINVLRAQEGFAGFFYDSEDKISVAKISPFQPIELYEEITAAIAADFKAPSTNQGIGEYQTTMFNVSDEFLPLSTNPTNPYYEENYSGDREFLDDKFIRFSYRFKFKDGEYSVLAPFTQIAFVPKQDGYFIYDDSIPSDIQDDMKDGYQTTIIKFMENKVDKIGAIIPMPLKSDGTPSQAGQIRTLFDIDEIEIIGKESSNLSLQLIDTIPASEITGNNTFIKYIYESTKPFKTLPSSEISRVFDKVPVKALAQEVSSNRIIYGNYQDKHTSPEGLDYNVTASNKSAFATYTGSDVVKNTTSIVEYPNHTLKQNRNYQVGFVLSDRYGRSSSVILSNTTQTVTIGGVTYGGSTLYHPYASYSATSGADNFPGDSLKVILNSSIGPSAPNASTNWPGLYNGDTTSSAYNPLGWYSYKIVVKQTQQEYYNAYLPGIMAAQPIIDNASPDAIQGSISNTVLVGDNINKIPRDLSEVGPQQRQFRSSVRLFPRVINTNTVPTNNASNQQYGVGLGNEQILPDIEGITVNTISNLRDLFDYNPADPPIPDNFPQFYLYDSNPLIAQLGVNSKLGQRASFSTPSGNASYTSITMKFGHPFYPNSTSCTTGTWSNAVNTYYVPSNTLVYVTDVQGVTFSTSFTSSNPYQANWAGGPTNVPVSGWDFSCVGTGDGANPPETPKKQYVNFDDDVDVPVGKQVVLTGSRSSAPPGIQQLAVVETEPTESVIDIYYETTSAGLISQINNVNDTDTGAASSVQDDQSNSFFVEANMTQGQQLFRFKAKDAAGQIIRTANTTPTGNNVVGFALTSVFTNESTPQDVTSYFANLSVSPPVDFEGNQDTGWYLTLRNGYDANVWYGSDAGKRSFTFNFVVTVTPAGQSPANTSFTVTKDLINSAPNIESVNPASPVELTYGNTFITDIRANNGANQNNDNRGKDITWSIVSATGANGFTYNNKFEIIGNSGNPSDLYNIGRLQRSTGGGGTQDSTFIVQDYTIVVRASDPGASTDQTIQVTMGNIPTYVKEYEAYTGSGSDRDDIIFVIIRIQDSTSAQNGYYLYDNPWSTLNNSNPIQIDYTNACTGNCASYNGDWFFASSESAVISLYEAALGQSQTTTDITTISTSAYQFIIV